MKAINEIKKQGYDVILTSHAQVPTVLQTTKYIIYDSNNVLTYHDYYSNAWFESGEYKMSITHQSQVNSGNSRIFFILHIIFRKNKFNISTSF